MPDSILACQVYDFFRSNLQSRVDSLKVELSNQNRSEKDVEKSLRRRLHEVISERDLLRHKLTSNK